MTSSLPEEATTTSTSPSPSKSPPETEVGLTGLVEITLILLVSNVPSPLLRRAATTPSPSKSLEETTISRPFCPSKSAANRELGLKLPSMISAELVSTITLAVLEIVPSPLFLNQTTESLAKAAVTTSSKPSPSTSAAMTSLTPDTLLEIVCCDKNAPLASSNRLKPTVLSV